MTSVETFKDQALDDENDIMNHLDYRKLEMIYNDYALLGGPKLIKKLDLPQFIAVMLHHLPEPTSQKHLVRNLIELFKEVDVNNDGDLQWDEFTNYIVELGKEKKDSVFVDNFKDYFPSSIEDDKHDTEIEAIYYFHKMKEKHLILMERDAKKFKVYNAKSGKCIPEYPSGKMNGLTGSFIAADYVNMGPGKTSFIATTNSNTQINLWETTNYTLKANMTLIDIQLCGK